MNVARIAFGLGIATGLEIGCGGSRSALEPTDLLCRPSSSLIQANPSLPVAACFSLFESYRAQLSCTPNLPITSQKEAYVDYFECLWANPSQPDEGFSILEKGVLSGLPGGLRDNVRERVFQKNPAVAVASRMILVRTDKNPNPEPRLADLPIGVNVTYGSKFYVRQTEEEGMRSHQDGVLEYWKDRGWVAMAQCTKEPPRKTAPNPVQCAPNQVTPSGQCIDKSAATTCALRVPSCCPARDDSCIAPDSMCFCDAFCVTARDCCPDACGVCGYCGSGPQAPMTR